MSDVVPKRQVYILGAGASYGLKLPIGAELTSSIKQALDFKTDGYTTGGGDNLLLSALSSARSECPEWLAASRLIASAMPLAPSIDNFVDVHKNNANVSFCAKAAIARCILEAEAKSTIYVDPNNSYNTIDFEENKGQWQTLFFRIVTMYSTVDDLASRLEQIAVVIFNYDRCFEHFLFHAIKTYYRITNEVAADLLKKLEIFHAYGQVGELPFLSQKNPVGYGEDVGSYRIIEISKKIRTFTESVVEDSTEVLLLRNRVVNAKCLIFLGFAFHPLNVKLLFGEKSWSIVDHDKRVFGTALHSSKSDLNAISWDISSRYNSKPEAVELRSDLKCDGLLTEYSRSLSLD